VKNEALDYSLNFEEVAVKSSNVDLVGINSIDLRKV
jgi:hypothetical protein